MNQTYKNWEIIAINDCSQDNSLSLLKNYAHEEERITIINHDKNKGPAHARLSGLAHSTGNYIIFVDSDDWLSPNSLELLIDKIQKEDADMVTGAMVRVMDKYGFIKSRPGNNYTSKMIIDSIEQPELFEKYFISFFGVNYLFVSVCGKLYRKDIVMKSNPVPNDFRMGEDLMFSMILHPHLNKIAFVDKIVYFYRLGGGTSGSNPTFLRDIKKQYRIKENTIIRYNYLKALPYIKYELINCFFSFSLGLLVKDNFSKEELKKFVIEELKDPIYTEAVSDIKLDERGMAIKERNIDKIVNSLLEKKKEAQRIYRLKQVLFNLLN